MRKNKLLYRRQNGSIFILTLWIVCILSMLATGLGFAVRQKAAVFKRISEREDARSLADAAFKRTAAEFSLNVPPRLGVKGALSTEKGTAQYRVEDENRRINLNRAAADVLLNLFRDIGKMGEDEASRLAYAVIDYRDKDDHLSQYQDGGSEADSYRSAGLPHSPKNADFETIAELLFVKGMTKDSYFLVGNYITIYGNGKVNINTADRAVLEAIGLHSGVAEKIVSMRASSGAEEAFPSLAAIPQRFTGPYLLNDAERVTLMHAVSHGRLAADPDFYRMEIEAKAVHAASPSKTACIFGLKEGVRYWAES